jgi:hypothetical protein
MVQRLTVGGEPVAQPLNRTHDVRPARMICPTRGVESPATVLISLHVLPSAAAATRACGYSRRGGLARAARGGVQTGRITF